MMAIGCYLHLPPVSDTTGVGIERPTLGLSGGQAHG